MKQSEAKKLVRKLPKGLTVKEAAKYLGQKYSTTRNWLLQARYKFEDGRSQAWPVARRLSVSMIDPKKVNWTWPNVRIAEHFGVSRERIRQLRNSFNK